MFNLLNRTPQARAGNLQEAVNARVKELLNLSPDATLAELDAALQSAETLEVPEAETHAQAAPAAESAPTVAPEAETPAEAAPETPENGAEESAPQADALQQILAAVQGLQAQNAAMQLRMEKLEKSPAAAHTVVTMTDESASTTAAEKPKMPVWEAFKKHIESL